jgi:hypothetical protein
VNSRRSLLTAALGFAQLQIRIPALQALHTWLDTWTGVGALAAGMARQGFDVTLEHRGQRWHVTFTKERYGVRPGAAAGYASDVAPWRAMQWAAWQVIRREL